ncbi:hypothetical protein HZS_7861 [Henneguya salminicola]|nr:hypothetical protein HZS_7861 [Henneguya salminicola]
MKAYDYNDKQRGTQLYKGENEKCYPFLYKIIKSNENRHYSWSYVSPQTFIDPYSEFTDIYRVSTGNENFMHCQSYDKILIVPNLICDTRLMEIRSFFEFQRFPVISYINITTKSYLLRCASPLEPYLHLLRTDDPYIYTDVLRLPSSDVLLVEFENILNDKSKNLYSATQRQNNSSIRVKTLSVNVLLIHDLKACLSKLAYTIGLINDMPMSDGALIQLSIYHWGDTVMSLIESATFVSTTLANRQVTALTFEPAGMDYTLILTSLVHIISRPCCRTYSGSFEFTDELLEFLYKHSYSSEFGTFLYNNSKERYEKNAYESTFSLWPYLNTPDIKKSYLNPLYRLQSTLKSQFLCQDYVISYFFLLQGILEQSIHEIPQ